MKRTAPQADLRLTRIAFQIAGIARKDMSRAEENIACDLVEAGFGAWDMSGGRTVFSTRAAKKGGKP